MKNQQELIKSLREAQFKIAAALAQLENAFDLRVATLADMSRAVCGVSVTNSKEKPLMTAFKHLKIDTMEELKEILDSRPEVFLKFRNIGVGKLQKMLTLSGSLVRVDRQGRTIINNKGEKI
jgi:uncharacterized protein (DUF169 family)